MICYGAPPALSGKSFLVTSETLPQTGLLNELWRPRAAVGNDLLCRRCVYVGDVLYASPSNRAEAEISLCRRKASDTSGKLLQGVEGPSVDITDLSREACCFPGLGIWDIVEWLLSLVRPLEYYALVLVHVSTNETAMDLEYVKHDYRALGMREMGMVALLDFDYFLDHGNDQEGFEGKWWMLRVSNALHSQC